MQLNEGNRPKAIRALAVRLTDQGQSKIPLITNSMAEIIRTPLPIFIATFFSHCLPRRRDQHRYTRYANWNAKSGGADRHDPGA
jgi:hypothetical protein